MTDLWLIVLLPLAAVSGWFSGRKERLKALRLPRSKLLPDYFAGLNFLLNEQTDQALDAFSKLLTVDNHTVEFHLALGHLFRRQGEVERAIRIHQNLIARPNLHAPHRIQSLLALANDYLCAGLLDRAERLYQDVLANEEYNATALKSLLSVYEQQKNWEQAILIAERLCKLEQDSTAQRRLAHYYCELSILAQQRGQIGLAQGYLKHALAVDHRLVRASLLLGESLIAQKEYQAAIHAYLHVKRQDPDYLCEILGNLEKCFTHLDRINAYIQFLEEVIITWPQPSIIIALAERMRQQASLAVAIDFLATELRKKPSLRGLYRLIELQLEVAPASEQQNLMLLHRLLNNLLSSKPIYQCKSCGFQSKVLDWLCPSCRNWSSIRPVQV